MSDHEDRAATTTEMCRLLRSQIYTIHPRFLKIIYEITDTNLEIEGINISENDIIDKTDEE